MIPGGGAARGRAPDDTVASSARSQRRQVYVEGAALHEGKPVSGLQLELLDGEAALGRPRRWVSRASVAQHVGRVVSLGQQAGVLEDGQAEAQASIDGARRVATATLAYHRSRTLLHAVGSRHVCSAGHSWVKAGPLVFSELALVVRGGLLADASHRRAPRSGCASSAVQRTRVG